MLVSGILRPSEVIFYHPLDDFVEYTNNDTWVGSGTFIPGKIGSAVTAGSKIPIWGTPVDVGINVSRGNGSIVRLDDTSALLLGISGVNTVTQVVTVSGLTITLGSGYSAGVRSLNNSNPNGDLFSSGNVVMNWRDGGNLRLKVASVSGETVSFGSVVSISAGRPMGGIASLTSGVGVIVYGVTSPAGHTMARVIEVSGTTITLGTAIQLTTDVSAEGGGSSVSRISDTEAVVAYDEGDGTTRTAIVTISGTNDLSIGTKTILNNFDTRGMGQVDVVSLSPELVAYISQSGGTKIFTNMGRVDGTNITISPELLVDRTGVVMGGIGFINSSSYIVGYTYSNLRRAIIYESDDITPLPGTVGLTTYDGTSGGSMVVLNSSLILHANANGDIAAGNIITKTDMESSSPLMYPVASGSDRVVISLWGKNFSNNGSGIRIIRDYEINIASGEISIGSAIWNDAGIDVLTETLNDGNEHLLVLDFEYDSGDWTLNTSIGGLSFVDQDIQNFGSQDVYPSSQEPRVVVQSGQLNQWFDELAMWAGNKATFDNFTDIELEQLFKLGVVFNLPLPKFDSTISMPLFIHGPELFASSGDLFIVSTVWQSGSSDFFTNSYGVSSGNNDLFTVGSLGVVVPDSMNLFVNGKEISTNSIDLFIHGLDVLQTSGELFLGGKSFIDMSGDLFVNGSVVIVASGNLFIDSHDISTASGDIFTNGHEQYNNNISLFIGSVSSGNLARSFDWLIKTHDYYPQIIGTLEGAASVNIQLWDITDGQNALISVTSSGCYAIGSTGRWGWSTTHLPPNQGNARHYFYMMTSNVSETFDGQFILDAPANAKWIYPSSRDDYIRQV